MDLACPERDASEILSDSDHSTNAAPTTLKKAIFFVLNNGTMLLAEMHYRNKIIMHDVDAEAERIINRFEQLILTQHL